MNDPYLPGEYRRVFERVEEGLAKFRDGDYYILSRNDLDEILDAADNPDRIRALIQQHIDDQ